MASPFKGWLLAKNILNINEIIIVMNFKVLMIFAWNHKTILLIKLKIEEIKSVDYI